MLAFPAVKKSSLLNAEINCSDDCYLAHDLDARFVDENEFSASVHVLGAIWCISTQAYDFSEVIVYTQRLQADHFLPVKRFRCIWFVQPSIPEIPDMA